MKSYFQEIKMTTLLENYIEDGGGQKYSTAVFSKLIKQKRETTIFSYILFFHIDNELESGIRC